MIELLALKLAALVSQNTSITIGLLIAQVVNAMIVFATFEYHWLKTNDDEFFLANRSLIRQLDRPTFELFRYVFIVVPLTSAYLWIRLKMQKFSTVEFLRDYGIRRKLL